MPSLCPPGIKKGDEAILDAFLLASCFTALLKNTSGDNEMKKRKRTEPEDTFLAGRGVF